MAEKLYKREAVETIILGRGSERHVINPGQVFEYTEAEVKEIENANPRAFSEKSVVNLDDPSGDIDLKKVETKQKRNQTNAPDAKGKASKNDDDM